MLFLKHIKKNDWSVLERKYTGIDYEYFEKDVIDIEEAYKMWVNDIAIPLRKWDVKLLSSWKSSHLFNNNDVHIPDELYYTKYLRGAPKFVLEYVVNNWEEEIDEETLEVSFGLKVKGEKVIIKNGKLSKGIVFVRYGTIIRTMFWEDVFK